MTEEDLAGIPERHRVKAKMANSAQGLVIQQRNNKKDFSKVIQQVNQIGFDLIPNTEKAHEFEWVFQVTNTETKNAFAKLILPTDSSYEDNKVLHNVNSGKPIAIISISTGLLKKLKKKSHLAFILGHEIKHHLEGHTRNIVLNDTRFNAFVHSQSYEVVADKGSLDLMVGKYSLDTIPEIFETILESDRTDPADPDDNFKRAVIDSVTTHHQRGTRIGSLQTYAMELKRTKSEANFRGQDQLNFNLSDFRIRPEKDLEISNEFKDYLEKLIQSTNERDPFSKEFLDDFVQMFQMIKRNVFEGATNPRFLIDLIDKLEISPIEQSKKGQILLLLMTYVHPSFYNPAAVSASKDVDLIFSKLDGLRDKKVSRWLSQVKFSKPYLHNFLPVEWKDGFIHFLLTSKKYPLDRFNRNQRNFLLNWNKRMALDYFAEKENLDRKFTIDRVAKFNFHVSQKNIHSSLFVEYIISTLERDFQLEHVSHLSLEEKLKGLELLENPDLVELARFSDLSERRSNVRNRLEETIREEVKSVFQSEDWGKKTPGKTENGEPDKRLVYRKMELFDIWLQTVGNSKINDQGNPADFYALLDSFDASIETSRSYSGYLQSPYNRKSGKKSVQKLLRFYLDNIRDELFFQDLAKIFVLLQNDSIELGQAILDDPSLRSDLRKRVYQHRTRNPESFKTFIFTWLNKESLAGREFTKYVFPFMGFSDKIALLYGLGFRNDLLANAQMKNQIFTIFETYYSDEGARTYKYRPELEPFLVDYLIDYLEKNSSLQLSIAMLKKVTGYIGEYQGPEFTLLVEDRMRVEKLIKAKISLSNPKHVDIVLAEEETIKYLLESDLVEILYLKFTSLLKSSGDLVATWSSFEKTYGNALKKGTVRLALRNRVTLGNRVQPQDHSKFLENATGNSDTEHVKDYTALIRLYSGVISFLSGLSNKHQLEMIDFLMGRSNTFSSEISGFVNPKKSSEFRRKMSNLRYDLDNALVEYRGLFLNSLFHGNPRGLLSNEGREELFSKLKNQFSDDESEAIKDIFDALFESEGRDFSVLFSFILAQKNSPENKGFVTQEWILRVILESFGVPGIKFGQYLAFTGEFKKFEKALTHFQDAVSVPEYFDIIMYLSKSFGGVWDFAKNPIIKVLGAGSVNLAVEYHDSKLNRNMVMNIPRENIQLNSQIDFDRFKPFIEKLASKKAKYQYLTGLVDLIQESVSLEFDKNHVERMHSIAESIYKGVEIAGWKIRTVKSEGLVATIQKLEKAGSISAVLANEKVPEIYKSSMGALYNFEYDRIFSSIKDNIVQIANPDLHDGQVFVNPDSKEVTVIDFGQSVPIDERQKKLGFDILSDLAQTKYSEGIYLNLDGWFQIMAPGSGHLDREKLKQIFSGLDPMDRFVKLISYLNKSGFKVPLSSIHFVLSVNRLIKLGQKVGKVANYQIGLRLYANHFRNSANKIKKDLVESVRKLVFRNSCQQFYIGK